MMETYEGDVVNPRSDGRPPAQPTDDDELRRMLNTPPQPKPAPKPAPAKPQK